MKKAEEYENQIDLVFQKLIDGQADHVHAKSVWTGAKTRLQFAMGDAAIARMVGKPPSERTLLFFGLKEDKGKKSK